MWVLNLSYGFSGTFCHDKPFVIYLRCQMHADKLKCLLSTKFAFSVANLRGFYVYRPLFSIMLYKLGFENHYSTDQPRCKRWKKMCNFSVLYCETGVGNFHKALLNQFKTRIVQKKIKVSFKLKPACANIKWFLRLMVFLGPWIRLKNIVNVWFGKIVSNSFHLTIKWIDYL
jgi:hypothetical protein